MGILTLLKKGDGVFTFSDYSGAKAARRLAELSDAKPFQAIRRRRGAPVSAYLVLASWYEEKLAAIASAGAAEFASREAVVADDFLGLNLSKMSSLVLGTASVAKKAKEAATVGFSAKSFLVYKIVSSALVNDKPSRLRMDTDLKVGGAPKAYLLHPAHYSALASSPGAASYSGSGDGVASVKQYGGFAQAETLTIVAVSDGVFSVSGSVGGEYGSAYIGETFVAPGFELLLTAGSVPFAAEDTFTFELLAAEF